MRLVKGLTFLKSVGLIRHLSVGTTAKCQTRRGGEFPTHSGGYRKTGAGLPAVSSGVVFRILRRCLAHTLPEPVTVLLLECNLGICSMRR